MDRVLFVYFVRSCGRTIEVKVGGGAEGARLDGPGFPSRAEQIDKELAFREMSVLLLPSLCWHS